MAGRVPQPMTLKEPIDYDDAREALSAVSHRRKETREELQTAGEALVEAERLYRKGRAEARVRAKSTTAADRKDEIDSLTADLRADRDRAKWATDILDEKLRELDGQRSSLHRLVEWSTRLDPYAAELAARAAGATRTASDRAAAEGRAA